MSDRNIPEFIQSILEQNKGFMKVKDLPAIMDFDMRRKLGFVKKNLPTKNVIKILEPHVQDRFIFRKKGNVQYILVPCDPSEFIINSLKAGEAVSPKVILKTLPFSKNDFIEIVNELLMSGRIRAIMNEKMDMRIILSGGHEEHEGHEEKRVQSPEEYTQARFKKAFDELEHGQTFVNIPELRKKLNWPHDVFDDMLRKLRDEGVVQLHKTDLTIFEPEEFFYDEDNARRGMVTWHER